jgi:hypothetical protein
MAALMMFKTIVIKNHAVNIQSMFAFKGSLVLGRRIFNTFLKKKVQQKT